MKRLLATIVVLSICPALAMAETVMVAVNESAPPQEEEPSARYYLSAAEAGAMDVFFAAGHIIFNAGTYTLDDGDSLEKRYQVRSMAQDGGAAYALHIELEFVRPSSDSIRPRSASYAMIEADGDRVLLSGTISIEPDPDKAAEELSFSAGRTIAEEVLVGWPAGS